MVEQHKITQQVKSTFLKQASNLTLKEILNCTDEMISRLLQSTDLSITDQIRIFSALKEVKNSKTENMVPAEFLTTLHQLHEDINSKLNRLHKDFTSTQIKNPTTTSPRKK